MRRRAKTASGRNREASRPSARIGVRIPGVLLAALILGAVCTVVFWNSFSAAFLLDNQSIILGDPRLRALDWDHVRDIFTRPYWWPALESRLFRPVTTLTYAVNFSGLGNAADPFGYHVVNLALHWINALLAFALVRAVSGRWWAAVAAAALFTVHPLTVESVTNVVGRADLLAAMSVLSGVLIYRRFLQASGRRAIAWLPVLAAAFCAGVFSKESAVVLPGIMLAHDLAFPPVAAGRAIERWRRSLARVWPAYLAILPGLLILAWARWTLFHASPLFGEFGSDNPIALAPTATAVMTAIKVIGYDLALVVWPAHLSCDYSYNAVTLFGWTLTAGQDAHAWLSLLVACALAALAVLAWRRTTQRAVFFCMAFAAVAWLPTSNLLFPIGTIMAERLMYLPLVGMAGAMALVAAGLVETRAAAARATPRTVAALTVIVTVAVLAMLAARTMVRNEDWRSNARLWDSSAEAAPDSIKVIRGQALAVMTEDASGGRADEAIAILLRAVRLLDAHPLPTIHTPAALYQDLGSYLAAKATRLAQRGDQADAQAVLREALPRFERAAEIDRAINEEGKRRLALDGVPADRIHDTGTGSIYRYLGTTYGLLGDPARAASTFAYLEHIHPDSDDAHYSRGMAEGALAGAERAQGRVDAWRLHLDRAATSLIQATVLSPEHAGAWLTLERVYGSLAPGVTAIRTAGGRFELNRAELLVQRHFRDACGQLVRQFREAGLADARLAPCTEP